jgi:muramoyltetrapeptide carboxypeptidase
VAVVAPAGPVDEASLLGGLAWLSGRYRVRWSRRLLERTDYLAGTDDARAVELSDALGDGEVAAVWAARGGFGTTRLLSRLAPGLLRAAPKWLLGFSDITALLAHAWAEGVMAVHGPHVASLGSRTPPEERALLLRILERGSDGLRMPVQLLRPSSTGTGGIEGVVVGGNLALLEALACAGRLHFPSGAIVLVEDVGERPYRVDRMLTALLDGGYFQRARAVVFGSFAETTHGREMAGVGEVLCRFAPGCATFRSAAFGHGPINQPFVVGASARLCDDGAGWALSYGD